MDNETFETRQETALRARVAEIETSTALIMKRAARAEARVAELERERDQLAMLGSAMLVGGTDWKVRAEQAEARVAELEAALEEFGTHSHSCPSRSNSECGYCDCGLDAALAGGQVPS